METLLFNTAYAGYTLCTLLYLAYLFTKKEKYSLWAKRLLMVAVVLHFGSLITRTYDARSGYMAQATALRAEGKIEAAIGAERAAHSYVPWSNWFESFSFFGLIIALIYLIITRGYHIPVLGAFVMPVSWGLLTVAFCSDKTLKPLLPALHSYWMAIHVPIMFVSYSILAVAFAVGIAYLLQERQMKSKRPSEMTYRLPSLDDLDTLIYKLIMAAFPPLTLGIFLGGVWAYEAWGRFWGWDPKETWALITWFVYVIYLHLRLFVGWRGRKTAYLSLIGFGVVLFTYVGVNYLSPLHGFLSGTGR
jgi:cytochrome c-type biogenesis protein CcsB